MSGIPETPFRLSHVVLLRRSSTGDVTPILTWRQYGDPQMAPYARSLTQDRHVLNFLREEWNKIAPSHPFRARILEDDLKNQYKKDRKWLIAIQLPAMLALGLACLGAFGLTSFSVARRRKEIGIRKVFGAPVHSLMAYLSFDFIKILMLAAIIAGPIAYHLLREWLQRFVYRIDLIEPIFTGSVLTFAFVMLTVSCKTYRAATQNPTDTLRDE